MHVTLDVVKVLRGSQGQVEHMGKLNLRADSMQFWIKDRKGATLTKDCKYHDLRDVKVWCPTSARAHTHTRALGFSQPWIRPWS